MKHASVIISDRAVSHREKCDSAVYYREINRSGQIFRTRKPRKIKRVREKGNEARIDQKKKEAQVDRNKRMEQRGKVIRTQAH